MIFVKTPRTITNFNIPPSLTVLQVHNTRFPLPPWGVQVMKCVYFSIPMFAGYQCYVYSQEQSEAKWGSRKAAYDSLKSANRVAILGKERTVGAGGVGGGVYLVDSSGEEQVRLMKGLDRVLKEVKKD